MTPLVRVGFEYLNICTSSAQYCLALGWSPEILGGRAREPALSPEERERQGRVGFGTGGRNRPRGTRRKLIWNLVAQSRMRTPMILLLMPVDHGLVLVPMAIVTPAISIPSVRHRIACSSYWLPIFFALKVYTNYWRHFRGAGQSLSDTGQNRGDRTPIELFANSVKALPGANREHHPISWSGQSLGRTDQFQ